MMEALSFSRITPPYMETEGSLQCSQEPATGSNPEPDAFRPHLPIKFTYDTFYYYLPIHVYVFRVVCSLQACTPKLYALIISPMRATCPTHFTLLDFIDLVTFG
jgi:hypothetical protein